MMAPELALSTSQTSLLSVDEDQRIVLEKSTIQDLIDASIEGVLHSEGTEEVVGQKTFFKPLNVDATALNLTRNQIQAIVNASFKANGMQYDIQPISVIAGAETDSPYNTYKVYGLPPGPIMAPTKDCLDGVLNEEQTDYMFFCANPKFNGTHRFARNEREHFANARAYRQALDSLNRAKAARAAAEAATK